MKNKILDWDEPWENLFLKQQERGSIEYLKYSNLAQKFKDGHSQASFERLYIYQIIKQFVRLSYPLKKYQNVMPCFDSVPPNTCDSCSAWESWNKSPLEIRNYPPYLD